MPSAARGWAAIPTPASSTSGAWRTRCRTWRSSAGRCSRTAGRTTRRRRSRRSPGARRTTSSRTGSGSPEETGGSGAARRSRPSDAPRTVAAGANSLGSRLRALRTGRGHSLAEVAQATGLSASFLSLVETGRSDITISRLVRVVQFYGVRITDLLDEVPRADSMVVRRSEHRHLYSRAEGIDVRLLSPDTRGAMMPMLTTYEPTGNWAEFKGAPGSEAFVYVLNGRLELDV